MQILILMTLSVLIYSLLCVCNQHDTHRDSHCRLVWRRDLLCRKIFQKCTPFYNNRIMQHIINCIRYLFSSWATQSAMIIGLHGQKMPPYYTVLPFGAIVEKWIPLCHDAAIRQYYGYKAQKLCRESISHFYRLMARDTSCLLSLE